jgi:hypothetical protein
MYRRPLLLLCLIPAVLLAGAPVALAGDDTTVTVEAPAPPPQTVTVDAAAPPAQTVTTPAPPPVTVEAPAPAAPETPSSAGSGVTHAAIVKAKKKKAHKRVVHAAFVSAPAVVPSGAVQAGGGGTAPRDGGASWLVLALGGGALLFFGIGWHLVPVRKRLGL